MLKLIQRISLICVICLTNSSFAQNDTICFPINEAKNLLKFAEKGYLCDSIIQYKDEQDSILRSTLEIKDKQITVSTHIINGQIVKIRRLRLVSGSLGVGLGLCLIFLIVH